MSNSKSKVQGRIPNDLGDRFEAFRKRHDLNQTEALKRILRSGLDRELDDEYGEKPEAAFASDLFSTFGAALIAISLWAIVASSRAHIGFALASGGIAASAAGYQLRRRAHE